VRHFRAVFSCLAPNFTKLADDIGRSSTLSKCALKLRYIVAFSISDGSIWSNFENEAKYHTFRPFPVKIREAVGEIYWSINKASPMFEPPEYITRCPLAVWAEQGRTNMTLSFQVTPMIFRNFVSSVDETRPDSSVPFSCFAMFH